MAYIISVNATILKASKGPCKCPDGSESCKGDRTFNHCLDELHRGYVVATAAAGCLSSALMGIFANMPIGLAPGLGANAYFAFTVVGSGMVSYGDALAVVWLEGWIFLILSIFGFPHDDSGNYKWDFFKKVATWHNLDPVGPHNINWQGYNTGKAWLALISFLYIDLLDTTGTLYAMAIQAGLVDERTGDFEGSSTAYMADALSISCGSLLGCSPCTAFIESVSGIVEGGRTGITALMIAFWFFISLFFAPIFSSLPAWATGSVLVIVGSMMMHSVTEINWAYLGDGLPAFLTIMGIPFFFNIAYGLIAGILSYVILNVVPWVLLKASGGRLKPAGWDTDREPWGAAPSRLVVPNLETRRLNSVQRFVVGSSVFPPWMKKLVLGNWRFWQLTDAEIQDYLEGRRETARRVALREAKRAEERDAQRRVLQPPDEEMPPLLEPGEKATGL
ncbi:hypothetical protein MOBT1_002017 [Malassezia obtusa]|uniref:Uncharacterized protein n=1 Tax=Malassezia obtusa TaxID=76774 RepID=A0AAF0E573_9BASI|nr:hypothetical protein MOBT1_002017 [Malassezia obtusa]